VLREPGESPLLLNLRVAPLLCFQVDCECHRLRTDLQNQDQTKEQLKALPWHWLDQEDLPEEVAKIFSFSEAVTQLSILVSGLERMAKDLDASTLKVYFLRHPQVQRGIL
jgi:tripartite motif-containing protein 40